MRHEVESKATCQLNSDEQQQIVQREFICEMHRIPEGKYQCNVSLTLVVTNLHAWRLETFEMAGQTVCENLKANRLVSLREQFTPSRDIRQHGARVRHWISRHA